MKRVHLKIVSALAFVLFASTTPVFAAPAVTLSISPEIIENTSTGIVDSIVAIQNPVDSNGISGFDICLSHDPTLAVTQILEPVSESEPLSDFVQVRNTIDSANSQICTTYMSLAPAQDLSQEISFTIQATGQGRFTVESVQVVGNIEGQQYDVQTPQQEAQQKRTQPTQTTVPADSVDDQQDGTSDGESVPEPIEPTQAAETPEDAPEQEPTPEAEAPKTFVGRLINFFQGFLGR